jgi:hypothetical protein
MASVTIARNASALSGGARLVIKTKNNSLIFSSKFAPREVDYGGYEAQYNEISRPDRKPILARSGNSLRTVSMSLFVGSTNIEESFDEALATLERIAESRIPVIIEYDPRVYGEWRITSMTYSSVERSPSVKSEITRANVDLIFTEITGKEDSIVNFGVRGRPKNFTPPTRTTMFKIAQQFYGTKDIRIVRAIASANNITNLRNIPPGKKIKLP